MQHAASGGSIGLLAGPFAAAAIALIPTGLAKLAHPSGAARALGSVGLPGGTSAVRALGAVEVVAGGAALAAGGRPAASAVAGLYLLFALVLARALLIADGPASCGCMGDREVAPSWLHLGLVLLAAATAGAATAVPISGVPAVLARAPLPATVLVVGAVALVYAAFLVASELPAALASYHPAGRDEARRDRAAPVPRFRLAGAR
jgi:hypothetical protein